MLLWYYQVTHVLTAVLWTDMASNMAVRVRYVPVVI